MADRKVVNKFYPYDYDPDKLRKYEKKDLRLMCNVRMMLPFSFQCDQCGNYMYIGTKFNMKIECVREEEYCGIKIYRFYYKCSSCYADITFKTDPRNSDYTAEWGARRLHEAWKDMAMAEEAYKERRETEMKEDAMKSLEYRTNDRKRENDILESLDLARELNNRHANIDFEKLFKDAFKEADKEDEAEIELVKEKFKEAAVKRIDDFEEKTEDKEKPRIEVKKDKQFTLLNKNGKKLLKLKRNRNILL